jgi:hypothetical protein
MNSKSRERTGRFIGSGVRRGGGGVGGGGALRSRRAADSRRQSRRSPATSLVEPRDPSTALRPRCRLRSAQDDLRSQGKRRPVAANPSPVAANPSPVAANPSPVAANPSPVAANPSPVAANFRARPGFTEKSQSPSLLGPRLVPPWRSWSIEPVPPTKTLSFSPPRSEPGTTLARFWDKGTPNGEWTDVVKVTIGL